jgi:hypothetical protein
MSNKFFCQHLLVGVIAALCTSCNSIQHYQLQAQYSHIQNNISLSTLDKVNKYTSRTPFHNTYEFEFNTSQNYSYALIFYISESNFSKSIIKHRNANDLHRNAIRIDDSKNILITLNKNLPNPDGIIWQQVANQVAENDARDGYYVMQEYIRLKISNL